jgi:hypothetical protein
MTKKKKKKKKWFHIISAPNYSVSDKIFSPVGTSESTRVKAARRYVCTTDTSYKRHSEMFL